MTAAGDRSDPDLARLAAAGDDRAFAELVRRHQDPLFRLLRRYLGSADEAQEAAHEAFVAAWAALRRYDPQRPFGAWLRTIAINKARDRGRRIAVRRMLFGDLPPGDAASPDWRDPAQPADAALIEQERLAALERAIAQLPRTLKEPLLLTALEGLSHKEAAEVLGVSAKSVETRAYRARKLLAQQLDAELRP
ncbi:MAG: RNA polymerase sigma factor [Caulobacterales bacterium]|nr:RNA polymerase sigma factor [Caulobacterales bacterium]